MNSEVHKLIPSRSKDKNTLADLLEDNQGGPKVKLQEIYLLSPRQYMVDYSAQRLM